MSEDLKQRVHITEEDLLGDGLDQRVEQMKAAQAQPLVQTVGAPKGPGLTAPRPAGNGSWWRSTVASLGLAGVLGGIAGWAISEVAAQPDNNNPWYGDSVYVATAIFVGIFATVIGLFIAAWDGIELRDWVKARASALRALPWIASAGVLGGLGAQKVFEMIMNPAKDRALEADSYAEALDQIETSLHFARGLGFALAGACIGAAIGLAAKTSKRAVNGAIGGAIGGFLGGFLFDFIGENADSGVMPRFFALALTGVVVGAAIGLVETARREHWLEIVSGGMAGKQFILYHDQTTIGSGSDCHITLIKDPGITPAHLMLVRQGQGLAMHPAPGVPVLINGIASGSQVLTDGDLVQVGSTVLRYRAKSSVTPLPGSIH